MRIVLKPGGLIVALIACLLFGFALSRKMTNAPPLSVSSPISALPVERAENLSAANGWLPFFCTAKQGGTAHEVVINKDLAQPYSGFYKVMTSGVYDASTLSVRVTGCREGYWTVSATPEGGDQIALTESVRGETVTINLRDALASIPPRSRTKPVRITIRVFAPAATVRDVSLH